MNSSTSTLNPYADSYVPMSKRGITNKDKESTTVPGETPVVSDAHLIMSDEVRNEDKSSKTVSGESSAVSFSHPNTDDDYKLKGQQVDATSGQSSEHSQEADSKFVDEESEIDLAYLQMLFSGVSDQSLADVYNFNNGDLDAAIEMMNELMSADNLPHSLGIEQQEESVSLGESSSVNTVSMAGESSSACPTVSAVAT